MPPIAKPAALAAENLQGTPSVRWALASLSLSMLLSALGTSIANVGLPMLAQAFSASFQQVQWVVLAYLLAITTLVVSVGRLGDIMGRKRLLLSGIFLFTVASILCGLAASLWMLIAARAVQGMGAAIMMALSMALVSETASKGRTGSAMGLLGTMSAIGTALGPTLGGALLAGYGWPALFFVNLPLGIVTLLLAHHCLPPDRRQTMVDDSGFDLAGTLLLALTLAAYGCAMTLGRNSFGLFNLTLLLVAAAGTGLFVLVEMQARSPLIPLRQLRNPALGAGFAMNLLVTSVVMATLVIGPFYLSGALRLDAAQIGLVMSCGPAAAALTGLPAGHMVDRFGAHRMAIAGLFVMAAGCLLLPMLAARFGIPGYTGPLVVITAGYAFFQAANNTTVMTNIATSQRGVVSGMLSLSRNLGLITGASVMGAVFALGAATSNILAAQPQSLARGMRITFAVATVLVLIALAVAAFSHAMLQRTVASRHAP